MITGASGMLGTSLIPELERDDNIILQTDINILDKKRNI